MDAFSPGGAVSAGGYAGDLRASLPPCVRETGVNGFGGFDQISSLRELSLAVGDKGRRTKAWRWGYGMWASTSEIINVPYERPQLSLIFA